ncbi:hypothetical protein FE844_011340 [Rhizobium indicum]|uniref:hypothetical protein n=1 Tax=Rhizobium indicum TaxID=2583231 RepID=UPI00156D513D|nr:hypothetical protein [Rhizobium indicum]QKK30138.1 hypothetical protein FE844_011340 [Rhizobium indicum]
MTALIASGGDAGKVLARLLVAANGRRTARLLPAELPESARIRHFESRTTFRYLD